MPQVDLDAIEARQKSVLDADIEYGVDAMKTVHCLVTADIPALVAEVRRLRKRLAMATEIYLGFVDQRPIAVFKCRTGWIIRRGGFGGQCWNDDYKTWRGLEPPTVFQTADVAIAVAQTLCEVNEHA